MKENTMQPKKKLFFLQVEQQKVELIFLNGILSFFIHNMFIEIYFEINIFIEIHLLIAIQLYIYILVRKKYKRISVFRLKLKIYQEQLTKLISWYKRLFRLCLIADGILSPQQTLPPALPPKSPRLVPVPQRRTISGPPSSTGGDQLQTKLRRLLNTDSKENVFFPDSPTQTIIQANGIPQEEKFRYSPGSLSPNLREEDRIKVKSSNFRVNLENTARYLKTNYIRN